MGQIKYCKLHIVTAIKNSECVRMGESATALHRVFIGGLFEGVTEEDVVGRFQSFGEVSDTTIVCKKDGEGSVTKTFGYVTLKTTTQKLNRCFAVYGGTMWKGSQIKVQLAKENFIAKLERERAEAPTTEQPSKRKKRSQCTGPVKPYSALVETATTMKKVVPGAPVEGERNWVIGKYGRPLPIVYIPKSAGSKKTLKVDPSKFCHCLKKLATNDNDDVGGKEGVEGLTWSYDGEEKVTPLKRKKKRKKENENDSQDENCYVGEGTSSDNLNDDVKKKKKKKK